MSAYFVYETTSTVLQGSFFTIIIRSAIMYLNFI